MNNIRKIYYPLSAIFNGELLNIKGGLENIYA